MFKYLEWSFNASSQAFFAFKVAVMSLRIYFKKAPIILIDRKTITIEFE